MDKKQNSFGAAQSSEISRSISSIRNVSESIARHFCLICSCILLALLFSPTVMFGQADTATIVGTVVDQSGAALPNAVVTLTNLGTNQKTVVKTDSAGSFVATPLKIGDYSIAVEAQGFKSATQTGVTLNVQDRLRVDFTMQIGSVSERVVVNTAAPQLQSESSTLGEVIDSKQVEELPLNGRDYTQLVALTTGVTKIAESGNVITGGNQSATNGNAGGTFAVNGTRGLLNNFIRSEEHTSELQSRPHL